MKLLLAFALLSGAAAIGVPTDATTAAGRQLAGHVETYPPTTLTSAPTSVTYSPTTETYAPSMATVRRRTTEEAVEAVAPANK
mmetsp:Transcript_7634/g.22613  ORF Transcript_7634/g.22613 Transcript_7634/m.22613 type:complete len:83 (+) Transcript_7634:104-352(+)|eukprot:CAMPEP_0119263864 /NCGR_PEP_ID=MMETSP1329-20130426/3142_1 /TAXON_ID=114041 /ORGANISM="Genus nov. species nov., Strain RCC1024" /LENGTH=82 /DNA_ID=CAMNT_0007263603 /DNA_START=87 /DNA_END=335 /DNA_ORIENTATION=-